MTPGMSDESRRTERSGGTRGVLERPPGSGIWRVRYADENGRIHREKVGPKGLAAKVYQKRKNEIAERRFFPASVEPRASIPEACLQRGDW